MQHHFDLETRTVPAMMSSSTFLVRAVSAIITLLFVVSGAQAACPPDLLQRAEQGDYNVQCYVGHLYLSGKKGAEQDFAKAKYWYERVIFQQGADAKIIAHANFVLGMLYSQGKGCKRNYTEAMQCFRIAAKQGYTDAHINIGLMFAKGLGVKKDCRQALYWWKLAAEKGHPTAPAYVIQLKKKLWEHS